MSWKEIAELHGSGIHFGSHGCGHKRLTNLSKQDVLVDAIKSKKVLKEKLGIDVSGYSYPWGSVDRASQRTIKRANYKFAVGGTGANRPNRNDPFYIPRIEILGSDSLEDFIAKLPEPRAAGKTALAKYQEMRIRRDRATYMDR
jgi:peptidoglycan/xylan/chitin deacetylase (PgdA/CDA1 family)